jgi:transposase
MGKAALKIKHYTSEELQGMLRKDEKYQQAIRLYACYQVSLGMSPVQLSALYNTSFKAICNWIHRFNAGGPEALIDKSKSGRPDRLTAKQLSKLKELVLNQSPEKHGFNTATWTGPMLISWIDKTFGVVYKKAQIYNILKSLGFSYQKGKGIYPEAIDREEKIEQLKKTSRRKRKQ